MEPSAGGRRLVQLEEVSRLLAERRRATREPRTVAHSAHDRFARIVTGFERDGVAAVVEVQAGPHGLVSLMTADAVDEIGLEVRDEAILAIKATNVVVEVPG